jgi:hypothetical protein
MFRTRFTFNSLSVLRPDFEVKLITKDNIILILRIRSCSKSLFYLVTAYFSLCLWQFLLFFVYYCDNLLILFTCLLNRFRINCSVSRRFKMESLW